MSLAWSESAFSALKPRPILSASQWADKHRIIPQGTSPEPGPWQTSRVPYTREPMDCMSDDVTTTVVLMWSSQVAKSEIALNVMGYYADQDPSPILLVQPALGGVEAFSKERIEPMFNATVTLRGKLDGNANEGRSSSRKSGNTIRLKMFPGGYLAMVGANAPAGLASRPIRIAIFDEIDRYPESAGTEGDPIKLGIQRTTNFSISRKILKISSPGLEQTSKIAPAFEESDKRYYWVPCPHCSLKQTLKWSGVRYQKDQDGNPVRESVFYECEHCQGQILDMHKTEMLEKGEWRAEAPFNGTAGFHLNSIYSPWVKLFDLVKEWCEIHKKRDRQGLMEFINLKLGEPWAEEQEQIETEAFSRRKEEYPAEVPGKTLLLTASVDVQDARVECLVKGWARGEESYAIDYRVIYGDPGGKELWDEVHKFLTSRFKYEGGKEIGISCATIDSGGHFTSEVYAFCKAREAMRVFAIRGRGGDGIPIIDRASRTNSARVPLFSVGVDNAKDVVLARAAIPTEGPGYMHFPKKIEFDDEYFKGLLSEKRVILYRNGKKSFHFKKVYQRNEPLDLEVYALAALRILQAYARLDLETTGSMATEPVESARAVVQSAQAPARPVRRVISRGVEV